MSLYLGCNRDWFRDILCFSDNEVWMRPSARRVENLLSTQGFFSSEKSSSLSPTQELKILIASLILNSSLDLIILSKTQL